MSDYVPTTEEVRRHWGIAVDLHRRAERLAEFDRWLAAHDAEVAAKAWDEGHRAGQDNAGTGIAALFTGTTPLPEITNPYRKAVQ